MIEWMFWLFLFFGVASLLWGAHTESPIFLATAGVLFAIITFFIWTGGIELEDGFIESDTNATDTNTVITRTSTAYTPITTSKSDLWAFNMILTGVAAACLIYGIGMAAGMWGNRRKEPQGPYS